MAENNTFKYGGPGSDNMANKGLQVVDIYHVPTGKSVQFKALMTEFSDAYASEWNSETAFGRMDPLQTFQRTTRTISIAFDVVAYSQSEASMNSSRISSLIQFLYPSYDDDDLMTNSPLCKIQFKNWSAKLGVFSTAKHSGLLGGIKGFTFSPDLDVGVFNEVAGDKRGKMFSKKMNVSFEFDVIHQHKLGWEKGEKGWVARAQFGNSYPYGSDASADLSAFVNATGPNKKSEEQAKAVPNVPSEAVASRSLLTPAGEARLKAYHKARIAAMRKRAQEKDEFAKIKAANPNCTRWSKHAGEGWVCTD